MPKRYILPIRGVDRDIYELIKSGKKKIETRAGSPKYKDIKDGDTIIFRCGKDSFERTAIKVKIFKSVEHLLKVYNYKDIDPRALGAAELKKLYNSFSGYKEKIKKFGIIAFELKR